MPVKQLAFIEFTDELPALWRVCSSARVLSGEVIIVALSLPVQLALQRAGLPCANTLPFFDASAHTRGLEKSEEWLQRLESSTHVDSAALRELNFCLRPIFSYLLWLSEVVHAALTFHTPETVLCPAGSASQGGAQFKMTDADRPLQEIVQQITTFHGRALTILPAGAPRMQTPSAPAVPIAAPALPTRALIRCSLALMRGVHPILTTALYSELGSAVLAIRQGNLRVWLPLLSTSPVRWPALAALRLFFKVLGSRFMPTHRRRFIPLPLALFQIATPVPAAALRFQSGISALLGQLTTAWADQFSHCHAALAPFIARKIAAGISGHIRTLYTDQIAVKRLLSTLKPALVISPHSSAIYSLLGEECQRAAIPAVMVTHGTHTPPQNRCEEIEHWRLARHLLLAPDYEYSAAQSPWALKLAAHFGEAQRMIPTGPVLFAQKNDAAGLALRQRLGIPATERLIVYAIAQRKRSSVRLFMYETDDEWLQVMRDLVSAVATMPATHLILKMHPSSDLSSIDIRALLPESEQTHILHRDPFPAILSAADLLVSYSSTTIEEALCNKIPVVFYDRWQRYCHIKSPNCDVGSPSVWPSAASYYVTRPENLSAVLHHALTRAQATAASASAYADHIFDPDTTIPLALAVANLIHTGSWRGSTLS